MAFVSLRSGRLLIDRLSAADIPAIVGYRNDPAVAEHRSRPMPFTEDDASVVVEASPAEGGDLSTGGHVAIRMTAGVGGPPVGDLVGDLSVRQVAGTAHAFELDLAIIPRFQGLADSVGAVRAVAATMFADDRVHRLVAYADVADEGSVRLFDRVGFHREGVLRSSIARADGRLVDRVLLALTRVEWSRPDSEFDVIAFDADDTLWQSEDSFYAAEARFVELITPFVDGGTDVKAALTAVERKNLTVFGYGVRAFGLSMVETATSLAAERLPVSVAAELVEIARSMLTEPVHLLPGVSSVLEEVGTNHRLVLITKGDLIHQTHKIEASGLAHHFERIEIVLEKDPEVYARIVTQLGIAPRRFCMVGNSVRSDILPVLAIGANAVHVPYHLLWDLEQAPHDHGHTFAELGSLTELPGWLTASTTARGE